MAVCKTTDCQRGTNNDNLFCAFCIAGATPARGKEMRNAKPVKPKMDPELVGFFGNCDPGVPVQHVPKIMDDLLVVGTKLPPVSMSIMYPKYYKSLNGMTEIDVYGVHKLFDIQDPSGAIQHASKKLLLSGVRTGGKSKFQDIKEARDTLNRWMELNPEV